MDFPLQDLRVLDMSRVLAGPFAGRILSDLGADVVKLEPPDGDITRIWGAVMNGQSGFFNQQNAGKRNICIDLNTEYGRDLVKDLVGKADILLENFRPGVMSRFGLNWEVLKTLNPKLIMCSVSGFGQDGPESKRGAYAPIIHAEAGLIARQSRLLKNLPPSEIMLPIADTNAALHGLVGILAALHMRHRTGRGQHLDIAMLDATIFTDADLHYELDGAEELQPMLSEIWQTVDGAVMVAGEFRYLWRRLSLHNAVKDVNNKDDMPLEEKISRRRQIVGQYFLSFLSLKGLAAELDAMRIMWGSVRTGKELVNSPTIRHRQSIVPVSDGAGNERLLPQSPYRFSDAISGVSGCSPAMGEHNKEVLSEWLNLDDEKIEQLESDQIIFS